MDKLTKTAQLILSETLMLPVAVAQTVQVEEVPGLNGRSGLVTVGYDNGAGKRKVTAQVVTPDVDAAIALTGDFERIADLIALGVRAMPSAFRPALPSRITECDEVRRYDEMRSRVRTAANTAIEGDLPWAA